MATNNEMEMLAILECIIDAPEHTHLEVHTDSKLSIGWLAFNYACNKEHIQRIRDSIFAIREVKDITMFFMKIKGHGSDRGNILVDREAVRQTHQK